MRATKLADLANRSANNKYGRPPDAAGPGRRPRPQRAGLPNNYGLIWTGGILLRIRRLGVRVPPSAPGFDLGKPVLTWVYACPAGIMPGVRLSGPGRRHAGPRHAMAALNGITGAHVDWPGSKGLNQLGTRGP
jgi:hypothetical protein